MRNRLERHTSGAATMVAMSAALLVPATFVAFALLRRHQLSLPDPYNNPYTNWSTACLMGFFALTIVASLTLALTRGRIGRVVLWGASLVTGAAWLCVAWFLLSMLRFVCP